MRMDQRIGGWLVDHVVVFLIVLAWIVVTGINAAIAKEKRLNVAAVVVGSIVLSPVVAWMYAAGMPSRQPSAAPVSQDTSWMRATSRP